ncbi:hypothetical protein K8S17_00380 [bacterium]|nr:hypothetical protein [bacterium]
MPVVDRDTGLGTTYERVAVARMLERFCDRHEVLHVLEGPVDGITGINGLNSIPLAQRGADVELVLGEPGQVEMASRVWSGLGLTNKVSISASTDGRIDVPKRSFDLVWNFNAIPQSAEPARLIAEMCLASSRFVMVFVSNTLNYGFPIHRLHHVAAREAWSHGDISSMNVRLIERLLVEHGFRPIERLVVDTPWWPDIDSPIEEVIATFLPFLKRSISGSKRLEHYTWMWDELPYFEPDKRARLTEEIGKHFLIERSAPGPLKLLFAHHRGVLAERTDA